MKRVFMGLFTLCLAVGAMGCSVELEPRATLNEKPALHPLNKL